ncbi:tetraspanin-16 isoform X2 [Lepus europaeus]|uniref:tetraspanin-16 isoform X2 n=1 Tax=Lepus europaeus TaxID=9983 RepID=UPI002B4AA298|nr:tetraspanin-16 isoform X2 [Lepus europaeus]
MAEIHTPYSSLKKLLSVLNGLMVVSGIVLLGLGVDVTHGEATLTAVLGVSSAYLQHVGRLCLVLGTVAIPLGLVGWYGATTESRGALLFVQDVTLEHTLVTLRKNYRGYNEPDDYSTQWNLVMEKLKCCGVNNYTDFSGSNFAKTTGHSYPRDCCKSMGTAACDGRNTSTAVIHQGGCFSKLLKITKAHSFMLCGGSLGAAGIQLPGVLATLLLFVKLG